MLSRSTHLTIQGYVEVNFEFIILIWIGLISLLMLNNFEYTQKLILYGIKKALSIQKYITEFSSSFVLHSLCGSLAYRKWVMHFLHWVRDGKKHLRLQRGEWKSQFFTLKILTLGRTHMFKLIPSIRFLIKHYGACTRIILQ